jgi:hypothetical protein
MKKVRVSWDESKILEIENNFRYKKYKESAHMAYFISLFSQPSLYISPMWISLISNEADNS